MSRGAWQAIVQGVTKESDTAECAHTHTHTHTHTHAVHEKIAGENLRESFGKQMKQMFSTS